MVSCVGKIFERVILASLEKEVKAKNLIPRYQLGFRRKHSSLDAVAHLRDRAVGAVNFGLKLAVAFLDIAKAFESVWKDGLV